MSCGSEIGARRGAERIAVAAYVLALPVAVWLSIGQLILPASINTWLLTMISGAAYATITGPQLHATTIFLWHVTPSIVFVCLTPIQFSDAIRRRWLRVHRWLGRVFAAASTIVGVTALLIGWLHAFAGLAESLTTTFSAVYFLLTLERSVRAARAHDRVAHRDWMIRHVATGYLVVTMRFLQPALLRLTACSLQDIFVATSVASFILNQLIAEAWIRSSRAVDRYPVKVARMRQQNAPAA